MSLYIDNHDSNWAEYKIDAFASIVDPDGTDKHGPCESTLFALNFLFSTCGKKREMMTKLLSLKFTLSDIFLISHTLSQKLEITNKPK